MRSGPGIGSSRRRGFWAAIPGCCCGWPSLPSPYGFRTGIGQSTASLVNWQTNLDIGVKAYLVAFIPMVFGLGGAMQLGLNTDQVSGGLLVAMTEVVALVVMVWILRRQKPVTSGRRNLVTTLVLLLLPICVALAMRKLGVVIVSTVVWKSVLSGFGEEFAFRGYFQLRLNQAFGRPMRLFGVQFGAGLIIASPQFGLWHADNTYDPALGFSSLAWGWGFWTFVAGLLFGTLRQKAGTLVAPGLAHGLPDAVGEGLMRIFGLM